MTFHTTKNWTEKILDGKPMASLFSLSCVTCQITTDVYVVYVLFRVDQSEFITYTASSYSGVMFDGLEHGLSFVCDLDFSENFLHKLYFRLDSLKSTREKNWKNYINLTVSVCFLIRFQYLFNRVFILTIICEFLISCKV